MSQATPSEQGSADPTYSELRRLIIEGHYAPGARLVEDRLARELGVSRTPVRQALARVASEGLVQIFPNRGAVVRTFTREDLTDAYDLRATLEGFAAFRAATRITAAQLGELELAALALEQALDRPFPSREAEVHFLVAENQRFHGTIIVASGNSRLPSLLPAVLDVPLQYRSFNHYTRAERAVSNFFHRRILDALRAHDADRARAMMQEHLLRGRDVLLESLA
jgi:DNA-binding GntR family transcriptional regulator